MNYIVEGALSGAWYMLLIPGYNVFVPVITESYSISLLHVMASLIWSNGDAKWSSPKNFFYIYLFYHNKIITGPAFSESLTEYITGGQQFTTQF